MNDVGKRWLADHAILLEEMSSIEKKICGSSKAGMQKELNRLLMFLKFRIGPHKLNEENNIFPELRKALMKVVIKTAKIEHDYLEGVLLMMGDNIAVLADVKTPKAKKLAIVYTCRITKFIRSHFSLEEVMAIPSCDKLTLQQQEKILSRWNAYQERWPARKA